MAVLLILAYQASCNSIGDVWSNLTQPSKPLNPIPFLGTEIIKPENIGTYEHDFNDGLVFGGTIFTLDDTDYNILLTVVISSSSGLASNPASISGFKYKPGPAIIPENGLEQIFAPTHYIVPKAIQSPYDVPRIYRYVNSGHNSITYFVWFKDSSVSFPINASL